MSKQKSIVILFAGLLLFSACKHDRKAHVISRSIDLLDIIQRDTLKVGTIYGPTSYFLFGDEYVGYDYEMAQALADKLGVVLKVTEARTELELEHKLQQREIDIAAYNIYETRELKKLFNFVLPQDNSYQVLVQQISASMVTDASELQGKKVYVKPNTIFKKRLENLNNELGNTFEIVDAPDSVTNEELIEMVAEKKIDYTVAYHNTALLYKSFYKKIDVRTPIGFEQRNGWLIRRESSALLTQISDWQQTTEYEILQVNLSQKYWIKSPYFSQRKIRIPKGAISPYDHYFKKYASEINWDWKLLAALAFHESRFDSSQVSWAGASGIMQLMPRTAAKFGLTRKNMFNPEKNIEAGVQYIKSLNLSFRKVENKEERIKFILAAYNSGPAHVIDAMALSQKHGKNPGIWFKNVEYYLLKKSEPEFYNDPVVKYGRFRGKETVAYVINTLDTYERYTGRRLK